MNSLSRCIVLSSLFGLAGNHALATIQEIEPNNTFATAQDIGEFLNGSTVVLGSLAPGDVDFYQVELSGGALLTVTLFDFTPGVADNDPVLALFDFAGTMIAFDDDGGPDFLSVLFLILPYTGTYYLGASGAGDVSFIGNHEQDFAYKLTLAGFPAPGALPLLVAGGLALTKRRRRRESA